CLVAAQRDEAVQFALQCFRAGEDGARDLDRRGLLADNELAQFDRGKQAEVAVHRHTMLGKSAAVGRWYLTARMTSMLTRRPIRISRSTHTFSVCLWTFIGFVISPAVAEERSGGKAAERLPMATSAA